MKYSENEILRIESQFLARKILEDDNLIMSNSSYSIINTRHIIGIKNISNNQEMVICLKREEQYKYDMVFGDFRNLKKSINIKSFYSCNYAYCDGYYDSEEELKKRIERVESRYVENKKRFIVKKERSNKIIERLRKDSGRKILPQNLEVEKLGKNEYRIYYSCRNRNYVGIIRGK